VPPLDMLCNIQGDVLESMIKQVIDDGSALSDRIDAVSDRILDTISFNEEQSKNAYSHVFKFISDQEGGSGANWKPRLTGLHLTPAPNGQGRSMWISDEGIESFQMYGEKAIKTVSPQRGSSP
jgi:hypothetical protein